MQPTAEDCGHGLACQVVVGRPETAGRDHQVGPGECSGDGLPELVDPIADDMFLVQRNAQLLEAPGEKQRVRIETVRGQQLTADREDLGRVNRPPQCSHGTK